jgi:uncharacterized protein (DUF488 family)
MDRSPAPAPTIWTVGHSTRSLEDLIALLRAHRVDRVVDVRAYPGSRRHPHFGRDRLADALAAAGVEYLHLPELGGRREPRPDSGHTALVDPAFRGFADYMGTPPFEEALQRLLALAADRRAAILCAEADPRRCHRSLIADALVARGAAVAHIARPDAAAAPHEWTPGARAKNGRVRYPGLWAQGNG